VPLLGDLMEKLVKYLNSIPGGPVKDPTILATLLAECWEEFQGCDQENMTANKLFRMEDVHWQPPLLKFVLERHGGTVHGSSRAELHTWELNLDTRVAGCAGGRYRQLTPRQAVLDTHPIAKEIAQLIIGGKADERLKWNPDGTVRVLMAEILPTGSVPKQTLNARRTRLRNQLDELLSQASYEKVQANVWQKTHQSKTK
jgi:hypothetical protein